MRTLTNEEQEKYIGLVHEFWPATKPYYTAADVNEEVAGIVDNVVDEVVRASRAVGFVAEIVKNLMPLLIDRGPQAVIKNFLSLLYDLVKLLKENRRYRFIVDTAALKNRSALEIALMNI